MSNFEIIKQESGRFELYQGNVLIGSYSRKDSAVRRMKKILSAEFVTSDLSADEASSHSVINNSFVFPFSFLFNKVKNSGNEQARFRELMERVPRSAVRGTARSPPRLIGGDLLPNSLNSGTILKSLTRGNDDFRSF